MTPLLEKWQSFGWAVQELDGHSLSDLLTGFDKARGTRSKPSVIIARTIPGRGVRALEGQRSHVLKLPPELAEQALKELS
jgi:transketolase